MPMLIERFLFLLLMLMFLYEVVMPVILDRPMFPHFKKSTWNEIAAKRAAKRLEQAKIRLEAAQVEAEAKRIEDEAKKLTQ
jgi:hypothetical protein